MTSTVAHSRIRGEGETVVLVHGIGHRRQAWGTLPELLADRGYDVVAVDLPGHGESPVPTKPAGYSMASHAEQLEELFDDLGLDRPHVIGNSLGGAMVLELATRESVRSALALAPAGFFPIHHLLVVGPTLLGFKAASHLPDGIHRWLYATPGRRRLALRPLYEHAEAVSPEAALQDVQSLRTSKGFWPHLVRGAFLRVLVDPQVPTTIAWGDHDRLLLTSESNVAKGRFPGVTHVLIPDAGHCPQIDQPEIVLEIAEDTFARAAEVTEPGTKA